MLTERFTAVLRYIECALALETGSGRSAAPVRRRALDCLELEDRTLLSASPIGPVFLVNTETTEESREEEGLFDEGRASGTTSLRAIL